MKSFDYVIKDAVGMHARPAAVLAKIAKESMADVIITVNDRSADASKLMQVMAMGIKQGTNVNVAVEGDGEEQTAERLEVFFRENL